jgi:hypothetical protein
MLTAPIAGESPRHVHGRFTDRRLLKVESIGHDPTRQVPGHRWHGRTFDRSEPVNTIHRAGLAIAGLATALLVAGAFVAQGYVAAEQAIPTAASITAAPTLAPEIVYVNPAPTPAVIQVTQAAPPATQPPVIHVIVPSTGGEVEGSDNS